MAFEKFDREQVEGQLPTLEAAVVITQEGRFLLSGGARRLLEQIRPNCTVVELYYDAETRRVAIAPLNSAQDAGPTRFSVQTARGAAWPVLVSAKEFVQHHRLPAGRETSYTVRADRVPGAHAMALLFDLREANGDAS